ncbi:DUF4942 domain-containing protein [Peptostreptococcus sp. D1]|uniref:DUF4942 domain-containing protein n=1 Tax=Peptostreptococcus sp. D1 TaxID=72304 RepID=UPI0008E93B00|nr:DUF4942 domain-containing protein [Peptostreptococcus sp. D1]SFE90086.1 protein of unknown function [Peptostreptococcus sp. D1]
MNIVEFGYQFYPTPIEIAEELVKGIECKLINIENILEPSAGKGDLADYISNKIYSQEYRGCRIGSKPKIDCIELDENLRLILKGKDFNVVGDDFLNYQSQYCYDLIIMNPPFANGDKHLLKAIDMMERNGGQIACILNKETLENAYSKTRKLLVNKLKEHKAKVRYINNAFSNAERTTDVDIALININIIKKESSFNIFEDLRKNASIKEYSNEEYTESRIALGDYIEALISEYKLEIEAGIRFIEYYHNFKNELVNHCVKTDKYDIASFELKIFNDSSERIENDINRYIEKTRLKFWKVLFNSNQISSALTNDKSYELHDKINEFKDYEFDYYNIKALQINLISTLNDSVLDSIDRLFEEFSCRYSYDEYSKNIHLFNGWKTNKSWKINNKVIIPLNSTSNWLDNNMKLSYEARATFRDMFVVFGYLDGKRFNTTEVDNIIDQIENNNTRKKVKFPYVTCDFYKKGTCHITFNNKEILDKLNRMGAKKRNWLPPGYGSKNYNEMSNEEKQVIDDFEGEEKYMKDKVNGVIGNLDIKLLT